MNKDFCTALPGALLPVVLRAGREILRHFRNSATVTLSKADGSPVTEADQNAEEIILEALSELAPGIPVVAEESTSRGQMPGAGDVFFLVDPLDGTREFTSGRSEFTINIALIANREPIFGMIYAPAMSQLYWTQLGLGAFHANVPHELEHVEIDRISKVRMSTRAVHTSDLKIVASRSHGSDELESWLRSVKCGERMNIGSSLKFCLVAEGKADLYPRFGPTREWDTAAGHAIVTGAGGCVTGIDGSPFLYGKRETGYLNPHFIVWSRKELAAAHGLASQRVERPG